MLSLEPAHVPLLLCLSLVSDALVIFRQGGDAASAKLKRGAMAAASAAVLNAIASTAGDVVARSDVDRGGEKIKDCSAGGDRELVRVSGMPVDHLGSAPSPADMAGDADDGAGVASVRLLACQLACCATVALVRCRRSRRLDAAGVAPPVLANPNSNFDAGKPAGVAGVAGDIATPVPVLVPTATARATGPALSSQPAAALRLKPPSTCATLLVPPAAGFEILRLRFPVGIEHGGACPVRRLDALASASSASSRLTSAATNPEAGGESCCSIASPDQRFFGVWGSLHAPDATAR